MNADSLRAFTREIADLFNKGDIRAPVHLSNGNEEELIKIFSGVKFDDWVLGSWRMHYQCLLKGVDPLRLKEDILSGRSIALCYPDHRILSSAIVGGVLPIALGIAGAIKVRGGTETVWVFLGDMTALTGMFSEVLRYARGWALPIKFVIEDNGKSVCTPTLDTWREQTYSRDEFESIVQRYHYSSEFPHSGAGVRVSF